MLADLKHGSILGGVLERHIQRRDSYPFSKTLTELLPNICQRQIANEQFEVIPPAALEKTVRRDSGHVELLALKRALLHCLTSIGAN